MNHQTHNQTIPHAIDAERAVLGCVLLNREAIIPIAPWLTADAFYVEQHAWIYAAMLAVYQRRVPPDTRTVAEELRRRGQLESAGGIGALAALVDGVPTSQHVEYYAQAVADTATRRALIAAGGLIAGLAYDEQDLSVADVVAKAQRTLADAAGLQHSGTLVKASDAAEDLLRALDSETAPGLPFGLVDVDRLTGGMQPREVTLVAARPGQGKSVLAVQVAYESAAHGVPTLLFSLEMSRTIILGRLASALLGIPYERIRDQKVSPAELAQIARLAGEIDALPLWIDDAPGHTVNDIRATCHRAVLDTGSVGLVVIDYLGLITPSDRYRGNKVNEIGEISRALKNLAGELNCPILGLHQLNRAVEQRADRIPELSDLRDSGTLEQDAALVVMIHRPDMHDAKERPGEADLYVRKNRHGKTGRATVWFAGDEMRFGNLERFRTVPGYSEYDNAA